ncbi:chaperone modulator CbpM [Alcaligenaceae bacterium CGII-47]|nr:chaperone modulator CbpM [Alcaligenaceae bacterium CGII-47]
MTVHITETVWLNASDTCSLEYIVEGSGLSRQDVLELVEAGVLKPYSRDRDNYFFHTDCVVLARKAKRLRDDFELDTRSLTLTMSLLRHMDALQTEVTSLRARLLWREGGR